MFHSAPTEDSTRVRNAKGSYSVSVTSLVKTYEIDYREYGFENVRYDTSNKMIIADLVSKNKGI